MNCEATNQIKGKKQIHRKTHSRKKVSEEEDNTLSNSRRWNNSLLKAKATGTY